MTSKSKNVYIDKFDDIVNKCKSTYQRTAKMMPVDVKLWMYIDFNKAKTKEKRKLFLQKTMFLIGLKKLYFVSDLNGEEIIGTFY